MLDLYFNENCGHLRNRSWASHPKGYYQPGVVAISKEGRALYRWRCVPNHTNMSGAGARPEPVYTWRAMQARLADGVEADLDKSPVLASKDLSWFRFMLIGLAHGWFLRPKMFPLARPGDKRSANPGKMMKRVYAFVIAWMAALVLLPLHWVAIAFASWCLIAAIGLTEIHKQFQNEREPSLM